MWVFMGSKTHFIILFSYIIIKSESESEFLENALMAFNNHYVTFHCIYLIARIHKINRNPQERNVLLFTLECNE